MNMEYYYLDHLVIGYFNQDCDMDGDTIEEIFSGYLEVENRNFKGLINNIDDYLKQDDKSLEEDFLKRYEWDFDPNLWGMTVKAFLTFVQEKTTAQLKQNYGK